MATMQMNRTLGVTDADATAASRWTGAAEVLLVLLVFVVHAGWPVPDVNESQYLGKAKHYWDSTWCRGDFFLCSADAHLVFYWTFGWLTRWLSLAAAAWLGRIVTWTLLAWSWRRLSRAVVPQPPYAGLSAALFVCLLERYHLAGEWVVGGVEAKGIAYVFVFLGLEALARGRWNRVWIMLGAAAAFHVLVGGWSLLLAAWVWMTSPPERPACRRMLPGLLTGLVLSLPGLVPALLLTRGVDPSIVDQANQIYVFQRLPHHLALHTLSTEELTRRLTRYGAQLAAFAVLCFLLPADGGQRRLRRFVLGALLVALCGLAIPLVTRHDPALAARLLRYYWLRLADAALPMGIALTATAYVATTVRKEPRLGTWCLACALLGAGLHLGTTVYERHALARPRADRYMQDYEDWRDVCEWIANHIDKGPTFLTPRRSQTFKWYTGHAEVVNFKDIPQDAPGIVEWWERIDSIHRYDDGEQRSFRPRLALQGTERLLEVGRKYRAEYLVTTVSPRLRFDWLYRNDTYVVYQLPRE